MTKRQIAEQVREVRHSVRMASVELEQQNFGIAANRLKDALFRLDALDRQLSGELLLVKR